jgi:L-threonylcarbamoyladenylate synthase
MQAQIVQILEAADYAQEIQRAAEQLSAGKLVVLPTETVYGVAAALAQIRNSPAPNPFTIHLARPEQALQYLGSVNDYMQRVMRKLWPGPVGLIFDVPQPVRQKVALDLGLDESDLYDGSSITLRCPDHPVFADVAAQIAEPVALTAGGQSIQRVSDLPEEILSRVEMIFDAGQARYSKPSTLIRVKEDSYEIARSGVYDERIIDRLLRTTILFVCSGNTCRSPMAEAIARKYLSEQLSVRPEDLEKKGVSVISAGSFAMPGARATPEAVQVLGEMGLDISRHRSRPLSVELIHQADFVYTMSQNHAKTVIALVPGAAGKVAMLDPNQDIEDPIGGDLPLYTRTATRLKELIEQRLAQGIVP